jgi:hypothetical protein
MSEFKGIKEKWVFDDESIIALGPNDAIRIVVENPNPYQENNIQWEMDRMIISKAPEMLELLMTIENDSNQVPEWLWDKIQTLIKEATTI